MQQYIQTNILKKHEEIEWLDSDDEVLTGYLVRRTPRTYRRLARLMTAKNVNPLTNEPDQLLLEQKMSQRKVKSLSIDSLTIQQWLIDGWIIKKIELSEDGRTPISEGYLMGPALYHYLEKEKQLKYEEQVDKFLHLQAELAKCKQPKEVTKLMPYIRQIINLSYSELKDAVIFRNWTLSKRMLFIEFLIAFLTLSEQKRAFDFKEIGAVYYKEIGGSKVFDRQKDDFIELLEAWLEDSLQKLGLVSHGQVTSVYFAGEVIGKYATYKQSSLHAVTDVALLKEQFETTNKVLWLVENRAILTRMEASCHFLAKTDSIAIGIDGHLGSAHRKFIQQIIQSPTVEQVIIWTDYDESGLIIANEVYQLINKAVKIKWIARDGVVYFDYDAYATWLKGQLTNTSREQEEVLGDEKQWIRWINR